MTGEYEVKKIRIITKYLLINRGRNV